MAKKHTQMMIFFAIILLLIALTFLGIPRDAVASASNAELTVTQTKTLSYNGKTFLDDLGKFVNFAGGETFENTMYDAITAKLDTETVTFAPEDFVVKNPPIIRNPRTYQLTVNVVVGGVTYTDIPLKIIVSKKKLDVSVKLNGLSTLTVKEGEEYRSSVEYSGFVGSDTEYTLDAPGIVEYEPKRPTTNYAVYASLAKSDYYEFNYIPAVLTIQPNPISSFSFTDQEINYLYLSGEYSPYCTLQYVNVGINAGSVLYAEMQTNMDKYYSSTGIFDDYKPIAAYRINLLIDNEPEENTASDVLIRTDNKTVGKGQYLVIHFANDGTSEVLTAYETEEGYISFHTSSLGDFVVLAETSGLGIASTLIIAFSIIGGIIIILLLFMVFRRKY